MSARSAPTNDYSWGTIDMPCMSNTIADSEPASSASNSDAWSSVGGNSQVPENWLFRLFSEPLPSYGTRTIEEATPVCYSNRSSLAVAVWRGNMESKCSNLQLDLTTNIKLCAPLTRGLCIQGIVPLSIQEIIAEFSKRFTWCRGSDWAWKSPKYGSLSDQAKILFQIYLRGPWPLLYSNIFYLKSYLSDISVCLKSTGGKIIAGMYLAGHDMPPKRNKNGKFCVPGFSKYSMFGAAVSKPSLFGYSRE
ncbi:hypothetical protein R3P38DRAFT_2798695 [Favolaschia claudopus]|uniref:Uncharacterized protein n=1 Tax=Favolaschia claudopus TaxID=2862362 RepID=A0AAW0A127_9AGAR